MMGGVHFTEDTPEMRIYECRLCPDPGSGTKLIFMNEAEPVMSAE